MNDNSPVFVLVETSHPGNIGSAARAIRTMGFRHLVLVSPQRFPDPQVEALAVGADDVLHNIRVADDLDGALADCHLVAGLSARRRGIALPEWSPREAAAKVAEVLAANQRVALVFGNEQSGLDSKQLARCHAMVRIPSVDDFSSLNLAQAVQVMAYELRLALMEQPDEAATPRDPPATQQEMAGFLAHLDRTLEAVDFHKGRSGASIDLRLRRFFQRARPDSRELRILHGILSDAERMARIATAAGGTQ